MQRLNPINNDNGFVLVASLLVLMILIVVGIAATNTTTIELHISGNEKMARDNFYKAESSAQEGAQRLQNENDKDNLRAKRTIFKWLFSSSKENDFLPSSGNSVDWGTLSIVSDPADLLSGLNDPFISLVALDLGVVKGKRASSLKMTSSSVYEYHLLGRAVQNSGQKIIEIGYKKRF